MTTTCLQSLVPSADSAVAGATVDLRVEVQAATSPHPSDSLGLPAFREEYRDQFVGGLLLHGESQAQRMSDETLAVPRLRDL